MSEEEEVADLLDEALECAKEGKSLPEKEKDNEKEEKDNKKSKEKEKEKEKKKDKDKDSEASKSRDRKASRSRDRKHASRSRDRKQASRSRDRSKSRDRDRKKSRSRDRDRDRKDRSRDRDRRDRDRSRDRRDKERDRKRSRSRSRRRRSRSRSRKKSRSRSRRGKERDRDRDRDRDREKEKEKEKDRKRSRSRQNRSAISPESMPNRGDKPVNVRPGDWMCPKCGFHNYRSKDKCQQCGTPAPLGGASTSVPIPSSESAENGDDKKKRSKWDEVGDISASMPDWLKDLAAKKEQEKSQRPTPPGMDPNRFKIIRMEGVQIRALIGKGGETIKEIRLRSGADIKIDHVPQDPEGNVTIVGDVERTEGMIKETLSAKGCPLGVPVAKMQPLMPGMIAGVGPGGVRPGFAGTFIGRPQAPGMLMGAPGMTAPGGCMGAPGGCMGAPGGCMGAPGGCMGGPGGIPLPGNLRPPGACMGAPGGCCGAPGGCCGAPPGGCGMMGTRPIMMAATAPQRPPMFASPGGMPGGCAVVPRPGGPQGPLAFGQMGQMGQPQNLGGCGGPPPPPAGGYSDGLVAPPGPPGEPAESKPNFSSILAQAARQAEAAIGTSQPVGGFNQSGPVL